MIGSDHRAGEPYRSANTDTMLLVRLNGELADDQRAVGPARPRGRHPGRRQHQDQQRLLVGGPNLLIKMLRQQVFPGLQVNHIVDVNFGGFADLVNAIGCVYTDVDHRYYNDTRRGRTTTRASTSSPATRSCAARQALQFVRFRHTDSDLVRNARQQDFIRWAKDQYGVDKLIANRDKLLRIFGNEHADRPQPAHDRRADQPVRPGRVLRRTHDQADQVPGPVPAVRHDRSRRRRATSHRPAPRPSSGVFARFMRPTHTAPKTKHPTFGRHARATRTGPRPPA